MSLKAFHVFFVACAIAMFLFLGIRALTTEPRFPMQRAAGAASLVAAAALLAYGIAFLRKYRGLRAVAGILGGLTALHAAPLPLSACPSCYGQPDSPVTAGLNSAMLLMLVLTYAVIGGIAALFFVIRRRTRAAAAAGGACAEES